MSLHIIIIIMSESVVSIHLNYYC